MAEPGGLGWAPPADRSHELRYALTTAMPATACPVVIGVNWYTAFDRPTKDSAGIYWIGREASWGMLRGGHCVCLRPPTITDLVGAQTYWNQGREGACVGFGTSRAASLYNRRFYDGFSLYNAAKTRDSWPGEDYSGTSVNAGLKTLQVQGAWRATPQGSQPFLKDGCTSFLWARSVEDVTAALKSSEPFVRILNSWGMGYPAEVRMPLEAVARLLSEGGEFGVPVDRVGKSAGKRDGHGDA